MANIRASSRGTFDYSGRNCEIKGIWCAAAATEHDQLWQSGAMKAVMDIDDVMVLVFPVIHCDSTSTTEVRLWLACSTHLVSLEYQNCASLHPLSTASTPLQCPVDSNHSCTLCILQIFNHWWTTTKCMMCTSYFLPTALDKILEVLSSSPAGLT